MKDVNAPYIYQSLEELVNKLYQVMADFEERKNREALQAECERQSQQVIEVGSPSSSIPAADPAPTPKPKRKARTPKPEPDKG